VSGWALLDGMVLDGIVLDGMVLGDVGVGWVWAKAGPAPINARAAHPIRRRFIGIPL
jgi:hypothetical protein